MAKPGSIERRINQLEATGSGDDVDVTQLSDDELRRIIRAAGGRDPDLRSLSDAQLRAIVRGGQDDGRK
jgi:hypothetical protein